MSSTPHILMSVSKSVLGLIVGILVQSRAVDVNAVVTKWIPEVENTAYAGATLRDLLDMRAGISFDEDYLASAGPIIEYRKAQNWDPLLPGEIPSDLRTFFGSLVKQDGTHGGRFHYVSPNTDLMGWVVERATGVRYADLVSELLWQPMGAGRDAYITVDRLGAPRCAGGFCSTTRDLARIGLLLAEGGAYGGKQIVPDGWIEDILTKGDPAAWNQGDFVEIFSEHEYSLSQQVVCTSGCSASNVWSRDLRPKRVHRQEESDRHCEVFVSSFAHGREADSFDVRGIEAIRRVLLT